MFTPEMLKVSHWVPLMILMNLCTWMSFREVTTMRYLTTLGRSASPCSPRRTQPDSVERFSSTPLLTSHDASSATPLPLLCSPCSPLWPGQVLQRRWAQQMTEGCAPSCLRTLLILLFYYLELDFFWCWLQQALDSSLAGIHGNYNVIWIKAV